MQLNDYLLPLKNFRASISTAFESEDLSGETSSTSQAHKGISPKEISASFIVSFEDEALLTEFYTIAEAITDTGDLKIYDITERSANAANVRQVIFCGRIDQREDGDLLAWRISFKLKQYLSVAEKTEKQQEVTADAAASTDGAAVAAQQETDAAQLPGFESVLKAVDSALALNET